MNEGKKDRRDPIRTIKTKNPVAKNASAAIGGGAAGTHKDKKKAMKQGEVKHKKAEYAEHLESLLSNAITESTRICKVCGQSPCNCTHIVTEEMDIPADGTPEYDQFIRRGGVNQKTPFDLGGADAYYGRQNDITKEYGFQKGSPEWDEYIQGYRDTYQNKDMRKDYGSSRSPVEPRRITKTSEAMNGITGPGRMDGPLEGAEEPEGDTVKNSLHTIIRVATHLDKRLSVNDEFPEWVSEKIGAIKGMMVNVMDYLISDQEMSHDTDAMEDSALTQHRKRSAQADADLAKREAARKANPGAASGARIKELEKRYPKEGWTHDSLADQLFEHERTYEEKLANQLKHKLGK